MRDQITSTVTLLALATSLMLTGCNDPIKVLAVYAPNKTRKQPEKDLNHAFLSFLGIDRQVRIDVGPPDASLLCWIIDPPTETPPRGTIILLHGYRLSMTWFRGTAKAFADAGYRAVLVDLRGHGHSTGDFITYGVIESRDMVQVIDSLEERRELAGPLMMWGISMGAVTAIRTAAADERVTRVVAIAPYTSLGEVLPNTVRHLLPIPGLLYSPRNFEEMIAEAAAEAGFDPAEAEAEKAVKTRDFPLLVMHGEWDLIAPVEHGRRIALAAGAQRARFIPLPFTTHITAHFDLTGRMTREALAWFSR